MYNMVEIYKVQTNVSRMYVLEACVQVRIQSNIFNAQSQHEEK